MILPLVIVLVIILILIISPNLIGSEIQNDEGGFMLNQFDDIINQICDNLGNLESCEIKAIIMIESSGNPMATNPNDPSWGLMGVTPYIGKKFAGIVQNEDLFDPLTNIRAGAGFLSYLKKNYEIKYPLGNDNGWVQMYNTGEPQFFKGLRVPSYERKFIKFYTECLS